MNGLSLSSRAALMPETPCGVAACRHICTRWQHECRIFYYVVMYSTGTSLSTGVEGGDDAI